MWYEVTVLEMNSQLTSDHCLLQSGSVGNLKWAILLPLLSLPVVPCSCMTPSDVSIRMGFVSSGTVLSSLSSSGCCSASTT